MTQWRTRISILLPLALMALMMTSIGSRAESDLMARIQERANLRAEIVKLINGSDPNMALAAYQEAMKEDDPELRLSITEAAFASKDIHLRNAAMRHFLDGRSEMRLEVLLPDHPDKAQQFFFNTYHGFRFFSIKVDPATDVISFDQEKNQFWSGQLVEDGFDLTYRKTCCGDTFSCTASLRPAVGLQLTGQLNCVILARQYLQQTGSINHAVVPIRIRMG